MNDQSRSPVTLSLFGFSIFYGGMVCIAGILANKQLALGPVAAEAGIFAFLLLVATSSAVAELHGPKVARQLVIIGFAPLVASVLLTILIVELPASPSMAADRLNAFEVMMKSTPRIWLGGIIAYGFSTLLNVTIFTRLRAREGSKLLWLRAAIASMLSQVIDTLIFISIAFYGVFPIGRLMAGQLIAKVILSLILVPPLVYAMVGFGRRLDQNAK